VIRFVRVSSGREQKRDEAVFSRGDRVDQRRAAGKIADIWIGLRTQKKIDEPALLAGDRTRESVGTQVYAEHLELLCRRLFRRDGPGSRDRDGEYYRRRPRNRH